MRQVLLLSVVACVEAEEVSPFAVEGVALEVALGPDLGEGSDVDGLRAPLTLTTPGVVLPGQATTVQIGSLAPGETAYVAYSLVGTGQGPCPAAMGGVCLDLVAPQLLGTAVADANGTAALTVPVPAGTPMGTSADLQAIAIRGIGGAQTVKSPTAAVLVTDGDVFVHEPSPIDVLFVVDDSCSMADEQQRLIDSFPSMLAAIFDLELPFHLGVVSTDMDNPNKSGRLQQAGALRWIDETTPNPLATFAQMANLGTNGSGYERGLDAVYASLDGQAAAFNAGFRRPEAQYAVVVLSDEQDSSNITVPQMVGVMLGEEANTDDSTFTSIVCPDANCTFQGTGYLQTTANVGGAVGDIRDADYSPALDDAALLWWTSVPYVLAGVPANPAAIDVSVDGVAVAPADWAYDGIANTVRFRNGYGAPAGAQVVVAY